MKIYDITIPITSAMTVWPGDPWVVVKRVSKIEEGANANVSHLAFGAHTGTHVDAPYHFIPEGNTLDQIPLERWVGDSVVVEFLDIDLITKRLLEEADIPPGTRRLLFKTRNSGIWSGDDNQFHEDFVALSPDGAQYLVDRGIEMVGIDYLSIAPFRESRPTHQILLGAGILILEGINLLQVPPGRYQLYCLPLKLVGVDGAPARAILVSEGT